MLETNRWKEKFNEFNVEFNGIKQMFEITENEEYQKMLK